MNFLKKADKKAKVNVKNEEALSYFTEIEKIREFSRKIAWIVAGVAVAINIILAIAIMLILPLKEVKPYLVKVETNTGYVETLSNVKAKDISNIEAIDKYFLVKYLQNREGYHYNVVQTEYRNVMLMSTSDVAYLYSEKFKGEKSPVKILKNVAEINIRPISIQIQPSRNAGKRIATIRFDAIQNGILDNSEYNEDEQDLKDYENIKRYIVTIEYSYSISKDSLTAEQRLYNPLGFIVSSYRLEEEIIK